ncbi:MAG TPA: hypothetical protein EYH13_02860 [Thermococcus paralvinellae]|uniref:Uncharacterized protein n=1 Tax=Thermococcus paralvinellae TaxID=582419 RepID=A0A832ZBM2_9EURY|nr:hypothetical protein [Thermococcus paralvinellae]
MGIFPRLVTPRSFTMGYSLWWILFTVVILDNRTTTMTEHQHTTQEQVEVKREGNSNRRHWSKLWEVKHVKTVGPYDLKATREVIKEGMQVKDQQLS